MANKWKVHIQFLTDQDLLKLLFHFSFHNDPTFLVGQVQANSVDPEEQSDLDLHFLPFHLHLLEALLYGRAILFKF